MTKRRLPIGIQTFRKIREENCYYVDKTAYIRELLDDGTHFFLSRPRRFGKSLFLDTLKELFEGNEPLFEGLHIHDHWDWSVRYAVLRFDFSSGNYQGPDDLRKEVAVQLDALENEAKVSPRDENASARLRHLMKVRKDFGLGVGSDRLLIKKFDAFYLCLDDFRLSFFRCSNFDRCTIRQHFICTCGKALSYS